jgi:ribosomal protein S18 acetylase RimI-like enzyme
LRDGKAGIRILKGTFYYIEIDARPLNFREAWAHLKPCGNSGENLFYLYWFDVPEDCRGQGWGRKLMKEILEDADKNRWIIDLDPDSEGPMTQDELIAWYERLGFQKLKRPGRVSYWRRFPGRSHIATAAISRHNRATRRA